MSTIESRTVLPAGTWNADPVHSQIGFEIAYMGGTFRGTFSPFAATLEVGEHDLPQQRDDDDRRGAEGDGHRTG